MVERTPDQSIMYCLDTGVNQWSDFYRFSKVNSLYVAFGIYLIGGSLYKGLSGRATEMGRKINQPSGTTMTPYSLLKTGMNVGHIFKIFKN